MCLEIIYHSGVAYMKTMSFLPVKSETEARAIAKTIYKYRKDDDVEFSLRENGKAKEFFL